MVKLIQVEKNLVKMVLDQIKRSKTQLKPVDMAWDLAELIQVELSSVKMMLYSVKPRKTK